MSTLEQLEVGQQAAFTPPWVALGYPDEATWIQEGRPNTPYVATPAPLARAGSLSEPEKYTRGLQPQASAEAAVLAPTASFDLDAPARELAPSGGGGLLGSVGGFLGDVAGVAGDIYEALPGDRDTDPVPAPVRSAANVGLEALDVPRREVGLPVSRELVDFYANLTGFKPEEAFNPLGIPAPSLETQAEIGSYITDPLNLIPGIGFTKLDDVTRLALKAKGLIDDAGRVLPGATRAQVDDVIASTRRALADERGSVRLPGGQVAQEGAQPPGAAQAVPGAGVVDEGLSTGRGLAPLGAGAEPSAVPAPTLLDEAAGAVTPSPGTTAPGTTPPAGTAAPGVAPVPSGAPPAQLPRGAMPEASLQEQLEASLRLGREGMAGTRPASVSVADMKRALDDAGLNSTGTTSEIANRYRGLQAGQRGGIGTPTENVQNVARKAFNDTLEATGDPEAARLAARRAAAQETTANRRAATMVNLFDSIKRGEQGSVSFANLPETSGWADEATALVGLPRTLKASFDLSAPGRQGLALAFRHPVEWAQSWAPMLRAWRSEDGMRAANDLNGAIVAKWNDRIAGMRTPEQPGLDLDAALAPTSDSGLFNLYRTGADVGGLERVPGFEPAGKGLVSGLARRIPGLENSERAYATFLNVQKSRTFDNMAGALWQAGERDPEVYRNLGAIIDHATGFGAAPLKGRFEGQALFSQRYTTSRLQFLTDPIVEGLIKGDLQTARAATENLVAFAGGMTGLLFLIKETGIADVEFDPRSSDFGKIRIGPQRFDFGAGFLPLIRTAARVATGQAKSATGAIYQKDAVDSALGFFRNKLAPIPSEVVTRIQGENPIGEEPPGLLSLEQVRQLFMPLIADAVLETFTETGDPVRAALSGGAELVGGAASAYGTGQAAQIDIAQERFGKTYDELFSAQQAEINAEIAESDIEFEWRNRVNPWWTARDDAFSLWQSDRPAEDLEDPIIQHILEEEEYAGLFPGIDSDGRLSEWIATTYGITRAEAREAATKVQNETGLADYIDAYREDVLRTDTGFIDAWLEAFNEGEADDPPAKKWQEFAAEIGEPGPAGASPQPVNFPSQATRPEGRPQTEDEGEPPFDVTAGFRGPSQVRRAFQNIDVNTEGPTARDPSYTSPAGIVKSPLYRPQGFLPPLASAAQQKLASDNFRSVGLDNIADALDSVPFRNLTDAEVKAQEFQGQASADWASVPQKSGPFNVTVAEHEGAHVFYLNLTPGQQATLQARMRPLLVKFIGEQADHFIENDPVHVLNYLLELSPEPLPQEFLDYLKTIKVQAQEPAGVR